jgi:hypothetical protein
MTARLALATVLFLTILATPADAATWEDCPKGYTKRNVKLVYDHFDPMQNTCRYVKSRRSWKTLGFWNAQRGFVTKDPR